MAFKDRVHHFVSHDFPALFEKQSETKKKFQLKLRSDIKTSYEMAFSLLNTSLFMPKFFITVESRVVTKSQTLA